MTRKQETGTVFPAPVILAEGTLLFACPELKNAFDYRVFVETPDHVRLQRRLKRDVQQRGRTRESVWRQYFDTVQPMFEFLSVPIRTSATCFTPGKAIRKGPFQVLCWVIVSHQN